MVSISLLVTIACSLTAANAAEDVVQLPFGSVRGLLNPAAREFLGVPYATSNRFEASQQWSHQYEHGDLDATAFSPQCPQLVVGSDSQGAPQSENCLSLNIFTPRQRRAAAAMPVLLWIHGGGLLQGSAMDPLYNGSATASTQNVIVVAINYRLGVLGFGAFNSSSLISSNNGFRDQVQALNWVRRHIDAFGGNGSQITIYGESAGGQCVAAQLTSPLSEGLFRGAIAESAGETNTVSLAARLAHTAKVLSHTGCDVDDLHCLQQLNSTELIKTINRVVGNSNEGNHWAAVTVGDDFSPDTALQQVEKGAFHKVPFMLGNNANEGALFIHANSLTSMQAECVYQSLGDATNATAAVLKGLYPLVKGQDNLRALIDLYSDVAFHCPHRDWALALDAAGASPWMYSFNRHPGCPLQPVLGAAHGFEVPYVFQQLDKSSYDTKCHPPPEDEELARQVGDLWGFFAREGRQVSSWPLFTAKTNGPVAKLDVGFNAQQIDLETGYRRGYCARLAPLAIPAFGQTSVQLNAAVARCTAAATTDSAAATPSGSSVGDGMSASVI